MATSREVFNRIRWDARFDPSRFVIGYRERGQDALAEKPYAEWDGTIPWHRVHYFSLEGQRVWDRDSGMDRVSSGEALTLGVDAPVPVPPGRFQELDCARWTGEWWEFDDRESTAHFPLRSLTWNVLSDRHDREVTRLDLRLPRLLATLRARDADIVALEEVTPELLGLLLAEPWVRATYTTSDATGETLRPEGQLLLSRSPFDASIHLFSNGKRALVGHFQVAGRELAIGVLHLTSDHARDAALKRAQELATITGYLEGRDALILGDLNARDEDPGALRKRGYVDAWRELRPGEAGTTFNPGRNALAGRTTAKGVPARLDRVLVRARELEVSAIELFGNEGPEPASDHDGIAFELGRFRVVGDAATNDTALAVLTPARLGEAIDAIRREHDPAFSRWRPHVNLVFGFVPQARFDEARALIAVTVATRGSFEVSLARFSVFEHGSSATVHLVCESEGALEALQAALAVRFPGCPGRPVCSPHLTVGRCNTAAEAWQLVRRLERDWKRIRFEVQSVSLLARGEDGVYSVRDEVPLGGSLDSWLRARGELETDDHASRRAGTVERVSAACQAILGDEAALEVTGSTRLGVAHPSSDLDLVCVAGETDLEGFGRALGEHLGVPVRVVSGARFPLVNLRVDGIAVDVILEKEGDPRALASCREADAILDAALARVPRATFETVLRAVRAWARARCIDSQAWGFLGGIVWAHLVSWGLDGVERDDSPGRALAHVLDRIALRGWPAGAESAAKNLTDATRAIVLDEAKRAAALALQILENEATLDELATTVSPATGFGHVALLAIEPAAGPLAESARGFLEARALGLVHALERLLGVRGVRAFANRGAAFVAIGMDARDVGSTEPVFERLASEIAREVPGAALVWRIGAISR